MIILNRNFIYFIQIIYSTKKIIGLGDCVKVVATVLLGRTFPWNDAVFDWCTIPLIVNANSVISASNEYSGVLVKMRFIVMMIWTKECSDGRIGRDFRTIILHMNTTTPCTSQADLFVTWLSVTVGLY